MLTRLKKFWRRLTRAYRCTDCGMRCKSWNGLARHVAKCKVRKALPQAAKAIRG